MGGDASPGLSNPLLTGTVEDGTVGGGSKINAVTNG